MDRQKSETVHRAAWTAFKTELSYHLPREPRQQRDSLHHRAVARAHAAARAERVREVRARRLRVRAVAVLMSADDVC